MKMSFGCSVMPFKCSFDPRQAERHGFPNDRVIVSYSQERGMAVLPDLSPALRDTIEQAAQDLKPTQLTPAKLGKTPAPDITKPWAPAAMVPLWGTASFAHLTEVHRHRYNQYFALQMAEEFMRIERNLIIAPLKKLLSQKIPLAALRELLESFLADEREHDASFRQLLLTARPDLYQTRSFQFFSPPLAFRALAKITAYLPSLLSCWISLAHIFEMFTVSIGQEYRKADSGTGDTIEQTFLRAFVLHAQDEARHCKLDALLEEWLVHDRSRARTRVNERLFNLAVKIYYDVNWGCDRPIRQLVKDFSELRDHKERLLADARLARLQQYGDKLAGKSIYQA